MTLVRPDFIIGRILIAALFLINGLMLLRSGDFKFCANFMRERGVPLHFLALIVTIILQLVGGVMILIGWQTAWAAGVLFVWMFPATYVFHAFWRAPPELKPNETYHLLKNMALAGALLMLVSIYRP